MPAAELIYQTALELPLAKVAVINAQAHPLLAKLCNKATAYGLEQNFKPDFNALSALGLSMEALEPPFDLILLFPAKSKMQTLAWMAAAMQQLNDRGRIIMAAANRHGAKSYETALKQLAGNAGSLSKAKCRILSAYKTAGFNEMLAGEWLNAGSPAKVETHGLVSRPGLFSWDRPDSGSLLLLEHLPEPLVGTGMDLCCGYGLLARHILQGSSHINRLHLVDADRLALDCAGRNTADWSDKVQPHWLDAATETMPAQLEWIVCNPPFHSGQSTDIGLGQAIISHACQSLRRGGQLFLVANRKLPYERILETGLNRLQVLAETGGFKIFRGVK